MAVSTTANGTSTSYLPPAIRARLEAKAQKNALQEQEAAIQSATNKGGVLGGVGYLGEKLGVGVMSSLEGIWDFTAGGLAKAFGADDWAERQFANDWFGDWYSHPEEWYNPSKGWQVAGDIAGGIGTSIPAMAAAIGAVALTVATAGTAAVPISTGVLSAVGAGAASVTAGLGAAGNAVTQAYRETGELTGKEFGYGALSGLTEGSIEGLSNAASLGVGSVVKGFTKSVAKQTAKTIAKESVIKTLAKGFVGEAFEEGVSEILDPYWQRMTYNPDAKNATVQEVAYAAFVGGMSGMIMNGAGVATDAGKSFLKGNQLAGKGMDGEVINLSKQLAEFEKTNHTGDETFEILAKTYDDLVQSLDETGGKIVTVTQKKRLGDLQRANTVAMFKPFIAKSAANIVNNAEVIAQKLNEYGYKTPDGKDITFTAEQLREGVEDRTGKSLSNALKNNDMLRALAVADATGHIMMDTERFEKATLEGKQLASQADLNRFVENATPQEIAAVSQELGIEDLSKVDSRTFNEKIATFIENGGAKKYSERYEMRKKIESLPSDGARPMPKLVNLRQDGTVRYSDGSTQIAITKNGDVYTIYDYESGKLSKDLNRSELNNILREYNTKQADILAGIKAQKETESKLKKETEELDAYARENIEDYKNLSAVSQSEIRRILRIGRAEGIEADFLLSATRVSARSGLSIEFSKEKSFVAEDGTYAEGAIDINNNRIIINPDAKSRSHEMILIHELTHAIYSTKDGILTVADGVETMSEEARSKIAKRYAKAGIRQAIQIADEINAHFAEQTLSNKNFLDVLVKKYPSLKERILGFFKKAQTDYASDEKLTGAAKRLARQYKKLFDAFSSVNQHNLGMDNSSAAIKARNDGQMSDTRFSLEFADQIADNQRNYLNNNNVSLSADELETAIEQTARMVEAMSAHKNILPEDKVGKTLVKNGSYDLSVENTTICVRTLAYNSFVDMVSEKIGRPLTQMESFLVSQKLYDIAKEPQCLYCYVSLDRKAYNDMILRYISQRDNAIKAYDAAGRPEITRDSKLYKDFLNGRKDTKDTWRRYNDWISIHTNGDGFLTPSDVSTEAKRAALSHGTASQSSQIKDMLRYAQSATWAKKQTQYVAYYDDILRMSSKVVKDLNKHYGLRWYSFSDYSGAFLVENMQQITDASIKGLKGLAYTKDTDFVKVFAPTGMNINISVYAKRVGNTYEIDPSMSANIDEAIELRKKYPNVGIVVVATDQQGVEWALAQKWSDVVIPFHTVRTGAQVAEFYNWTIFNEEQNDGIGDQNLWERYVDSVASGKSENARKKVSKNVYPSEHQNNRETYLNIIAERGLKPRFSSFLDNPNYMKLVNETRQSESQTVKLRPVYNLEAAQTAFQKFVDKGGYYEGWYNDGIDVDSEVDSVAEDIRQGKRANEVEYGRQDIDVEALKSGRKKNREHGRRYALDVDSEGTQLTEAQQEFFKDSKVRDPKGRLLVMYHGTTVNFNTFKKGDVGFHFGTKAAARGRVGYGKNAIMKRVHLNITNPIVFEEDLGSWDADYRLTRELFERDILTREEVEQILISDDKYYRRSTEKANQKLAEILLQKGYDGIAYSNTFETKKQTTSYIVFQSNQAKVVENEAPTSNPDIRYALSLDGENVEVDIEKRKNLVAIHNLSERNLLDTLDLGGFPMPSVAIVKAEQEHASYGNISVIFGRETIDPQANPDNKVYGSDAWTPTSRNAATEYKVDFEKLTELEKNLEKLGKNAVGGIFTSSSLIRSLGVEDVTDQSAAQLAERLASRDEAKAAYLASQGKDIELEYKEKVYNVHGNKALQTYIDETGAEHLASVIAAMENNDTKAIYTEEEAVRKIIRDTFAEEHASYLNRKPELKEKRLDSYMENNVSIFTIEDFVKDAWRYHQEGRTVSEEIDKLAMSDKLLQAASDADVKDWLEPQVAEILGERGIYNGTELFDNEGNARSFSKTHYTYTAENIVRAMKNASSRGEGIFTVDASSVIATATPVYESVDDIHADEERLRTEDKDTYDAIIAEINEALDEVEKSIMRTTKHHADNTFDETQIIGSIITEAAEGKKSIVAIQKAFSKEDYRISPVQAKRILDLYEKAAKVPTGYFEAKPERVVSFSEIKMVELPNTTSETLKIRLQENNIPYEVYGNTDAERSDAIRNLDDVRFALSDDDLDPFGFDDELDNFDFGDSTSNSKFDFNAYEIVNNGSPYQNRRKSFTVGEVRKMLADRKIGKVYSKAEAFSVVNNLAGIHELTQKAREDIADEVWQALNESTSMENRKSLVHDLSTYIVAKMITDAKVENPDVNDARELLHYMRTGIGNITFSEFDISEIRHIRDKKGLRRIVGRWGKKRRNNGTPINHRIMMEEFVVDFAREVPGMEYLEDMHPVDAFLEIDERYKQAKETVNDKWISGYWEMPDSEIPGMIKRVEDSIMQAYETEGTQSKFSSYVENLIANYTERIEYWKSEYDTLKGKTRLLGLLMTKAQKMKDLKFGTFANATQHDSDIFKNSIAKLAKIQFRGNLNVSGTRAIIADLRKWYTSDSVKTGILEYVDESSQGYYVQDVADMMEKLETGKKGFTKDDLKMLYDVMSYFVNFVESWGKVFRHGKWIEAEPEAKRYVGVLNGNDALKVGGVVNKLSGTAYMQTFGDPMTVARRMDRYESGFYTEMMQDLRDATVDAQVKEMRLKADYDAFLKANKNYVNKASVETVAYRGVNVPKMNLIGLYMTMKRQHAQAGLAVSGFSFADTKGKRVRVDGLVSADAKITEAELKQHTQEQLAAIEKLLTKSDKEYIAILERAYNEDARQLKVERDMQRLGYTNATTDYYYPIRRGNIAKNVDTNDVAGELDRVSNASFNKDTVKGAKQELFIESADTVFNRHIHAVVQYAYLSPAVEAYNRLYNLDVSGNKNKPVSVATESANTWARANQYFSKMIADIQGIPPSSGEGSKALTFVRSGYAKFQLGANPKVWLTQISSIFAASSILDADCLARGMTVSSKDVDQYCSLAWLRNNDDTAARAQGVLDTKVKRVGGVISKIGDALMKPIGMMDRFVICRLFGACQAQVQKNGGAKIGTEANKIEAGKLLRRVILETQQNSVATERSAAMRSGNNIVRAATMFTSDSMKVIGRVIDATGEVSTLKAKVKVATDAQQASALKEQLKQARGKARRSLCALVMTAVYMAAIAQLFRFLYAKEQDEDESVAKTMVLDAVGNLFGGLPIFKDIYARIFDGYDVDNYAYSALNDLLDSAMNLFNFAEDVFSGKADEQERNRAIRKLAYSVGQLLGLPTRNIYNVLYGVTKRTNPEAAYVIDNAFYKKNFRNALYKAIEEDDEKMVSTIMSLLLGERMSEDIDEAVFNELLRLNKNGQKILPKEAPSSIKIKDEEYTLSDVEKESMKDVYTTAQVAIKALISKPKYQNLSDEQKAEAIEYIYDIYHDQAKESVLGIDTENTALLFADIVGEDNLALLQVSTKGLKSDTDRRGEVISGSKRKKVIKAINALGISTEKKLLLISARGYSLQDNDIRGLTAENAKKRLIRYILSLRGKTKAEKAELAEKCGFEVKNGRIVTK